MWIKKLVLQNFKGIELGLNTDYLEIDFSHRKNKICLLVAPNGTGKTTILSCLTPFATVGDLDIRNSNGIICTGKDGYKEIIIMNGIDEYLIKHYYTPNDESHSIKSYVFKNGVDLNPNGNVRSFLSVIKDELGIDISYLKLIRLGDNVTNLIKLSTTERKTFMSKLLDELNVYLAHHKKLTSDFRELKVFMSHTVDKIKKLNIDDLDNSENDTILLKNQISINEQTILRLRSEISVSEHELSKLPSSTELKEGIRDYSKKVQKIEGTIGTNANVNEYITLEHNLNKQLTTQEIMLTSYGTTIESSLASLDEISSEEKQLLRELDKINTDEDILSLESICLRLREEVNDTGSIWDNFKVSYTKNDIDSLLICLNSIQDILTSTYEFGKKPVSKVVKLISKKKSVVGYIGNKLMNIDMNRNSKSSVLLTKLFEKYAQVKIPDCAVNDSNSNKTYCPAYKAWSEIKTMLDVDNDTDDNESEEFYKYMEIIHKNLSSVLQKFTDNKSLFEKLPEKIQEQFRLDVILTKISNCEQVYDIKLLYDILTQITEYENYCNKVSELNEVETRIAIFKRNDNSEFIKKRLKVIDNTRHELMNTVSNNRELITKTLKSNDDIKTQLVDIKDTIDAIQKYDDYTSLLKDCSDKLQSYEVYRNNLTDLYTHLKSLETQNTKDTTLLSHLSSQIEQYKILSGYMEDFQHKYDELSLLISSSSSKEGIPLLYIDMFMSDMKLIANNLLDIVYNGSLTIHKFDIRADKFDIPYIKEGRRVSDISIASQGEQAFLSIAISFAMVHHSLSEYNIMLLDEPDAALDIKKREKFIDIIEHQMEEIMAEQAFAISHNNKFYMYPVDIIYLKDDDETRENMIKYKLANRIPIKLAM